MICTTLIVLHLLLNRVIDNKLYLTKLAGTKEQCAYVIATNHNLIIISSILSSQSQRQLNHQFNFFHKNRTLKISTYYPVYPPIQNPSKKIHTTARARIKFILPVSPCALLLYPNQYPLTV
jgi:hypothetical protein